MKIDWNDGLIIPSRGNVGSTSRTLRNGSRRTISTTRKKATQPFALTLNIGCHASQVEMWTWELTYQWKWNPRSRWFQLNSGYRKIRDIPKLPFSWQEIRWSTHLGVMTVVSTLFLDKSMYFFQWVCCFVLQLRYNLCFPPVIPDPNASPNLQQWHKFHSIVLHQQKTDGSLWASAECTPLRICFIKGLQGQNQAEIIKRPINFCEHKARGSFIPSVFPVLVESPVWWPFHALRHDPHEAPNAARSSPSNPSPDHNVTSF